MKDYKTHEAVMVEQVIRNLILNNKGNYVDCTFGMGGHTTSILKNLGPQGNLTSLDRDYYSCDLAKKISLKDKRMSFINDNFGNLESYFLENSLDGILLDLGISSSQLNDPDRGFSFQNPGPLDMRMDQSNPLSAEVWINNSSKSEIEKVFWEVGEEKQSRRIAKLICSKRLKNPIKTTEDLSKIILSCKGNSRRKHPATNIFRAIRMIVNSEIDELKKVLDAAGRILKIGGRLIVISFHSLEDRVVKRFIQGKDGAEMRSTFKLVGGKPIRPDLSEIKDNPKSRSAILRIGERVA